MESLGIKWNHLESIGIIWNTLESSKISAEKKNVWRKKFIKQKVSPKIFAKKFAEKKSQKNFFCPKNIFVKFFPRKL